MAIGDDLSAFKHLYPKLNAQDGHVTSPDTVFNNCFAWAAGDKVNRWEISRPHVWFTASKAETVENYLENYGYVGFEETDSCDYEEGFEKIALYVDKTGEPQHAARLLDNGSWTSKLGNLEDIEHKTLECIECDVYGIATTFLKRPKGDPETWIKTAMEKHLKGMKD